MNESARIKELIEKFLDEQLTGVEQNELDQWVNSSPHNRALFERVTNAQQLFDTTKDAIAADEKIAAKLREMHPELLVAGAGTGSVVYMRRSRWRRLIPATAAAVALASVVGLGYMWMHGNHSNKVAQTQQQTSVTDKAPGKDGAILKLSNGEEIVLDDAANGTLAQQGHTRITKQGGLLAYNGDEKNKEVLYNTLSTPRARQFQLVLPDGSHVWLNAASSIKFPASFSANERRVEITGEAYFEVVKNAAQPFRVMYTTAAREGTIEVLGTHFNVNAYNDEAAVKTTLIEGRVRIANGPSTGNREVILKPGQQAQVKNDQITVVEKADVNAALAWKNGLIVFNGADIKEVLRQVSRWYDVDFVYQGNIQVPEFYGEIPRTVNLADVLKIIEMNSKLKFTINGNKVTVAQP
jgi:ferric-dicitrate binding protein FerR (iron transport regulator)